MTREMAAWHGFLSAYRSVARRLDAALEREDGFDLSSYRTLECLREAGSEMRMRDLAAAVGLSRSGLTRMIDRLQAHGYVARREDSEDKRGLWAVLTVDGRESLEHAGATYFEFVTAEFCDRFNDDEQQTLAAMMGRLA